MNNMSNIKINRARNLSQTGKYPQSFNAMLDIIPSDIIKKLTSKQLSLLLDSIWEGCQQSKRLESIEICDQGYIWDSKQNRIRDLKD